MTMRMIKKMIKERYKNFNKKLSCRRENARRFVSLNILLYDQVIVTGRTQRRPWRNVRGGRQQAGNVIGSVPDEHRVHKQAQLVHILYSLCDRQPMQLQRQKERDLESGVRGRSRSLKMAPFYRSYTTFYRSAIVSIALCSTIFKLFHVE